MGEVQGYSHSHSDHTLQDAIVYCLRRGGGLSETNVEPTNYLEMVEQLWHDRDKYIGMWRSQCTIAEEVMQERDRLTEKLEEAIEEAKVWQDRYRKRGYVMDEHAKALERAEVAEAELARYKQGVELETIVHSNGSSCSV